MKYLGIAIEVVAFLTFAWWGFSHQHPVAGAFALTGALFCSYTFGETK
jgi:hypothetical protein